MEFKYTSKFQVLANFSKGDFPKESFVSKANMGLDDLKRLLPPKAEIVGNPDLLYTVFNAAVVNLINLNGDGISTDTALKIANTFKNKPMNIEHYRSDVVGFITNVGFSSFVDNKILTQEQIQNSNDPFNISLAAIVWKVCNGGFSEFLQDSQNERDYAYKSVSASWEVGFNDYWLTLGSKDIRRAEIIKDADKIKELEKHLLCYGGTGFTPDGTEIYRLIVGDARFLGCAFTTNPAAAVSGVVAIDANTSEVQEDENPEEDKMDDEEDSVCDKCGMKHDMEDGKCKDDSKASIEDNTNVEEKDKKQEEALLESLKKPENQTILRNFKKNDAKIAFCKKTCVIRNTMKYKTLEELFANDSEASVQEINEFVRNSIREANEKFVAEKTLREDKEKALNDAVANAEKTQEQLEKVNAEVAKLKSELKAQADSVKFNERMASIKEEFELTEAGTKSVAKQINGLEDEEFTAWLEEMKPFLPKKQEAKASVEDEAAEALKGAKAKKEFVPNASEGEGKDKKTKMKESWTKGVEISL